MYCNHSLPRVFLYIALNPFGADSDDEEEAPAVTEYRVSPLPRGQGPPGSGGAQYWGPGGGGGGGGSRGASRGGSAQNSPGMAKGGGKASIKSAIYYTCN